MTASCRPLRDSDAAACAALHAQSFRPAWPAHDIADQIARADRVHTGLVLREAIAGFALSRVVAGEADVLTIVLDRGVRGRGLSGELLGRHLSALGARATAVFLEVGAGNTPARALYRRFGFVETGIRRGYYVGTGVREDAVTMRLDLT